jgi:hypothetical protein
MNSTVHEDGVAIHFSMASVRGAWISDGQIQAGLDDEKNPPSKNTAELMKRRDAWTKALERQGVQFRFLATPQIESGMLDKYRVLILPYSIALSDKEAAEIGRFMDRGGIVYGDDQTGRMDAHCRWRSVQLWKDGHKGFERGGPRDLSLKRDFGAEFLVSIRDFGKSRLTGLLPEKAATVRAPAGAYDLLRGGLAKTEVTASPSQPALFIERASRIAKLSIDRELNLRLTDAGRRGRGPFGDPRRRAGSRGPPGAALLGQRDHPRRPRRVPDSVRSERRRRLLARPGPRRRQRAYGRGATETLDRARLARCTPIRGTKRQTTRLRRHVQRGVGVGLAWGWPGVGLGLAWS